MLYLITFCYFLLKRKQDRPVGAGLYEKAKMTSACALLIANDILQAVDNVYLLMFVI